MRPRKRVLIYAQNQMAAGQVGYLLRTRMHVADIVVPGMSQLLQPVDADLVIVLSDQAEMPECVAAIDQACGVPVLVWCRAPRAGVPPATFLEEVKQAFARRRGPKTTQAPPKQPARMVLATNLPSPAAQTA